MKQTYGFYLHDKEVGYVAVKNREGVLLPYYLISTPKAKRYAGLRLILKDLNLVKSAISELQDLKNKESSNISKRALSFYAVVTYAKCYTEANGGRGVQLNSSDTLKSCTSDLKLLHEKLMAIRNKYVAHAGFSGYEQNPVVASLDPNTFSIVEIRDNMVDIRDIDSELQSFYQLVCSVILFVETSIEKAGIKLSEEVEGISHSELKRNAIHPDPDKLVFIYANPHLQLPNNT